MVQGCDILNAYLKMQLNYWLRIVSQLPKFLFIAMMLRIFVPRFWPFKVGKTYQLTIGKLVAFNSSAEIIKCRSNCINKNDK